MDARHEKAAEKKDLMIDMDPEIARIFQQSTAVSSKFLTISNALILLYVYSQQGMFGQHAAGWQ